MADQRAEMPGPHDLHRPGRQVDLGVRTGGEALGVQFGEEAGGPCQHGGRRVPLGGVGAQGDAQLANARIARFPKPYVALMDGIVMGGGVGVSAHAGIRVVTERSRVAMPETAIGFVPDVGGTYLLANAPGRLGTHLALTGRSVGAADAVLCGLADHHVPSRLLPALTEALGEETGSGASVEGIVQRFATPPPAGELAAQRAWIDHCYAADTVEEIVRRLRTSGDPGSRRGGRRPADQVPTALKVTLAAVRRAARLGMGSRTRPGVPRLQPGVRTARLRGRGTRPDHRQGQRPAVETGLAVRGRRRAGRPAPPTRSPR
ncbi:Carnitinyl-CoA dehydratase [Streptomyces californicus]